jgi:shikimate kinase
LAGKNDEELKTIITQQLQNRSPFYEQAQYTIDVNVLDSYDKISIIVSQIQQILNLENGKMEN